MATGKAAVENEPEGIAAVMEQQVDATDFTRLKELGEQTGLPQRTIDAFINRFKRRYLPVKLEAERITTKELVRKLETKANMALEYMDDIAFNEASLRDLAVTLGILLEKRQLLNHEATVIIGIEERKHLNELIPAMLREAERRGMLLEHEAEGPARVLPRLEVAVNDISTSLRRNELPVNREFN